LYRDLQGNKQYLNHARSSLDSYKKTSSLAAGFFYEDCGF